MARTALRVVRLFLILRQTSLTRLSSKVALGGALGTLKAICRLLKDYFRG